MLYKTFLLTSACCAGLVLAPLSVQAQNSQSATAIAQPKGGWAVTKIDDPNVQGKAYCTLARQYENGIILSIGRNQAEEYSLAVDFQEAKLNLDKAYKITLKAGANQTRQLELMPASPRAMVIRLGWDDSFFEALEKSQAFSISLDQESFSFSLPEYYKGKADLNNCMSGLKSAQGNAGTDVLAAESGIGGQDFAAKKAMDIAPGASTVDPAKRPESTTISSLDSKEVPDLSAKDEPPYVAPMRSTDLASLEQENAKLKQMLDDQRKAYEAQIAQNNQGNKIAELEEKLRVAEAKGSTPAPGTAPVPEIKEITKPDPAQALRITELEQAIAGLEAEKSDLTQKLATAQQTAVTPATRQADPAQARRIEDLQKEAAELSNKLKLAEAAQKKAADESAAKVAALEKSVAELTAEKTTLTAEKNDLAQKYNATQNVTMKPMTTPLPNPEQAKRIADLQREVDTLKAQAKAPAQTASLAADTARIAELEKINATYTARITELQQQLATQAAVSPATSAVVPSVTTSAADIARLTAENETLKNSLQQRNQEIVTLETKLAAAPPSAAPPFMDAESQRKNMAASKGADKEIAALQAEVKRKEDLIRSSQARTQAQQQEIEKLRQQAGRVQQQDNAASVTDARLKQENNSLRSQVARQGEMYEKKLTQSTEALAESRHMIATGIQPILQGAGIVASPDAARPAGVSDAYQWRSGSIKGRAQAVQGAGNALDVSQTYANQQRGACNGDFASVPGAAADGRVSLDIACVTRDGGTSQSLLFAQQGGQVLTFILEAPAQDMDVAMEARDKIAGTF